ncbi:Homocysteine S-methyltransferase [Tricladium varicosporioides]|nr:Homocysteine S-methyltransferase [Hymenoscyphus varicosporioides]
MSHDTKIHLLDGGLGTLLADRYDCAFNESHPLWSSHLLIDEAGRKTLLDAQKSFATAGADVILTATYQASFEGFAATKIHGKNGFGEVEARMCMQEAVRIARYAGKEGKVALSLGAYGACMVPGTEYSGKYDAEHQSIDQLKAWHATRLSVFSPASGLKDCWNNIDFVAFETLPVRNEILAARQVMSLMPDGEEKPFWISCVFPGEANTLPDGTSVEAVVDAMLGKDKGAAPMAIGINCTRVGKVEGLIIEMEDAIKKMIGKGEVAVWPSLVVYPDGTRGEVYNTATKQWEKKETVEISSPWDEMMFDIILKAKERGSWKEVFVGGCCKTTPEDISKLRLRIDKA